MKGNAYVGKIANAANQVVEAPNQKKYPKQATVHTGSDLRNGKKSK